MTVLDLLILLVVVSASLGGYRAGFIARATAWSGLILGIAIAFGLIPVVVALLGSVDDAWTLLAALAVLVAAAAAGQVLGLMAGERLRIAIPDRVDTSDRVAGAAIGGVGVFVILWLLVPTLSAVPGWTADQVSESLLTRVVVERLPEPPDTLGALRDAVGEDTFPAAFNEAPVIGDPGPAPASHQLTPRVEELVARSVVKVWAATCGSFQEGSGYAVGDHLVVTNAHVVAGGNDFRVTDDEGEGHSARLVVFDPIRDLAVLYAPDYERPPLFVGDGAADDVLAAFGHPGGSGLRVAPARVSEVVRARGRDLYDTTDTVREVLVLAVALDLGDSGAPVVNAAGEVVGVAFAVAPDASNVAYAVTSEEVAAALDMVSGGVEPISVDSQGCL